MSDPVKYIVRFILFLLLQALVLNHVPPLHRFASPIIYFQFLLWMPFSISRLSLLFSGFALGFALDLFTHTPGLHASAATLIAYLRPFLISIMVPKDTRELAIGSPSWQSMGNLSYFIFTLTLTLFHHTWLVFLEWMTFANFFYFAGKVVASTVLSMLLMLATELLFRPVKKARR